MKGNISGDQANTQQWDSIVLKKKTPLSTKSTKQRILTEEEKIERQKTITPVLRQNIQTTRIAKKLTQKQLAATAALPISTIQEYENGKRIFNEQEVKKLERALQCKLQRR
jgi:ribosome-binding protein aMBF1 (putative translation factor)